jgi:hypothetical protein
MPPPQTMTLDFKPGDEHFTQADFTYSITPDAISITDKETNTSRKQTSRTRSPQTRFRSPTPVEGEYRLKTTLRLFSARSSTGIRDRLPGSRFSIGIRTETGRAFDGMVDGPRSAIGETDEKKAMGKLRRMEANRAIARAEGTGAMMVPTGRSLRVGRLL